MIWRVLDFRNRHRALFDTGTYLPLAVAGRKEEHICAFARMHGDELAIVIAPRLFASLTNAEPQLPLGPEVWGDAMLRLPSALPFIFSALKVATTLAMIGAIVSEYFGGSTKGLGYRIREDAQLFRYPESWSAIIIAALLGILFYLVVSAVERAMMPWHISFREE